MPMQTETKDQHLVNGNQNQGWLVTLALSISIVFCAELILKGLFDYHLALQVGRSNLGTIELFQALYSRLGVEYTALIVIYGIWLFRSKDDNQNQKTTFIQLCKPISIFLLLAFIAFPITSDVYQYLHYGLMSLNGVNPYLNPANSFTSNLSPLLAWGQSSTYALVSQSLFMISAAFVPISILLGVYVFKLFCLLIYLLGGSLIWNHFKSSQYRSWLTTAYLINPLLLFELVANAHVDVLICTALIAAIILLKTQRYVATGAVLWAGFLSKTVPVIWFPLVFFCLVRDRRWRSISYIILMSSIILIGLWLIAFPTPRAWISIFNSGTTYQTAGSLHNILDLLITNYQPFITALTPRVALIMLFGFRVLTYLAFILFYGKKCLNILFKSNYSIAHLIQDMGWVTLFLFLFATPWYQPWYACILVPFIIFVEAPSFSVVASVYCLCSTFSYYSLAYTSEQNLLLGVSLITVTPAIVLLINRNRVRSRLFQSQPKP